MKIPLKTVFILFIALISFYNIPYSYALSDVNITLKPDNLSVVENEETNISVIFSCEENINISAFRIQMSFDSSKFVYKGLYSKYSASNFKIFENSNTLTILYLTDDRGINIDANSDDCLLELNFKSTADNVTGAATFSASADGICNYDYVELPCSYIDPVSVLKTESEPANCNLASLASSEYILSPNFSPDITKYSIDVPYSKSSIEFETTAEDPEASVNISRRTLNAAGKSTDINITVKSPDNKSKKVYTVTVNRGTKESALLGSNNKSSKKSSQKSSKSSKSKSKGTSSINESLNSADPQNQSTLVVKENSFNFPLFFIVSGVVVTILIFLLTKGKTFKIK